LFVCVYSYAVVVSVAVALVSTRGTFCQPARCCWRGVLVRLPSTFTSRYEEEKESDITVLISNEITWIYHRHVAFGIFSVAAAAIRHLRLSTLAMEEEKNNIGATMCSTLTTHHGRSPNVLPEVFNRSCISCCGALLRLCTGAIHYFLYEFLRM
jgi:hypothetical protein